jgi:hypothetical protein
LLHGQWVHCFYRDVLVEVETVSGEYATGRPTNTKKGRPGSGVIVNGMVLVRTMLDERAAVAKRYGVHPSWKNKVDSARYASHDGERIGR